ncbi:MAG: hypothetical protein ACI9YB_000373 [Halioglobus sp.]|jgi:hypothetical protein
MKGLIVKVLIITSACALLLLGVVVLSAGMIVKTAVNTLLPKMTQTEAGLEDVNVSFMEGRIEVKGLYIANPKGFSDDRALYFERINLDVELGSFFRDKIVIEDVSIIGLEVLYEQKILGTNNIQLLLANIEEFSGGSKPAENSHGASKDVATDGQGLMIKHFLIAQGKLRMEMLEVEKEGISLPLPPIELHDLGKDGEDVRVVLGRLAKDVFMVTDKIFVQNFQLLEGQVKDIGESLKKTGKKLQDDAKGLFDGLKGFMK